MGVVFGDDAATLVVLVWGSAKYGGGGEVWSSEWDQIMMRWWCHGLLPAALRWLD